MAAFWFRRASASAAVTSACRAGGSGNYEEFGELPFPCPCPSADSREFRETRTVRSIVIRAAAPTMRNLGKLISASNRR